MKNKIGNGKSNREGMSSLEYLDWIEYKEEQQQQAVWEETLKARDYQRHYERGYDV